MNGDTVTDWATKIPLTERCHLKNCPFSHVLYTEIRRFKGKSVLLSREARNKTAMIILYSLIFPVLNVVKEHVSLILGDLL